MVSSRVPTITVARGPGPKRVAAGLWARATALRDALPEAAAVEDKLPGIEQALLVDGASLHLARSGHRAAGFAVVVPHGEVSELRYLATDPWFWGGGIAQALLAHVSEYAIGTGADAVELWVIADNDRAVWVYERAGWTATADVEVRHAGGRPERRYVRQVGPRAVGTPG